MSIHKRLVKVFSGTFVSCLGCQTDLEGIGVSCIIKDVFQSSVSAGHGQGTHSTLDLYILESDLELAKQILVLHNTSRL
ncbi:MAG: hypothetical protein U9N86_02625 [Bacteroidota bacterium]|nr:hypothetical protein [Bacteroidota bacterium]